jgi:hypothetical protein
MKSTSEQTANGLGFSIFYKSFESATCHFLCQILLPQTHKGAGRTAVCFLAAALEEAQAADSSTIAGCPWVTGRKSWGSPHSRKAKEQVRWVRGHLGEGAGLTPQAAHLLRLSLETL